MSADSLSEIVVAGEVSADIEATSSGTDALAKFESLARSGRLPEIPLLGTTRWRSLASQVQHRLRQNDYVVLRGLPVTEDGASLLLAALTAGSSLRTYRGGKIVKRFRMTPWTTELSHTLREGEFHTDLNTDDEPPPLTAIQCHTADPGTPQYGLNRVARLADLLKFLRKRQDSDTYNFLTQDTVTMLNDRASTSWSGRVFDRDVLRYHPETLRAAARRNGLDLGPLEQRVEKVKDAAMAVSSPFLLDRGDVLLVSNHRALHYRGECSVLFKRYPTDFQSRCIFVLHVTELHSL